MNDVQLLTPVARTVNSTSPHSTSPHKVPTVDWNMRQHGIELPFDVKRRNQICNSKRQFWCQSVEHTGGEILPRKITSTSCIYASYR